MHHRALLLILALLLVYVKAQVLSNCTCPGMSATNPSCGETFNYGGNSYSGCADECLAKNYQCCGCNLMGYPIQQVVCFGCPQGSKCYENPNQNGTAVLRRYCVSSSSSLSAPVVLIGTLFLLLATL